MTAQFTAKPRLPSGPSSRFESYTPAYVFGLIMTGAWLVAGWSLFGYYGGPTAFSSLSPAEVGLVICGGILPLMAIWILCGMLIVGTRMRNAMMAELSTLRTVNIMPEETQAHIKSITRAFEDRVEHLQGVTSGILTSLETASHQFEHQTTMLDTLSLRVDEQATSIATALSIQGNQLTGSEGRIDRMVNRMKHAMEDVRDVGEEFRENLTKPIVEVQETLADATRSIHGQIDDIWSRLELLDAAQAETEEATARTREALEAESENLRVTADAALNSVEAMSTKLSGQIETLKSVSGDANDVGDQMQVRLEEQSRALRQAGHDLSAHAGELHEAIQHQASHLSTLQASVDSYGGAISEEFEKKIERLMSAAKEAADIVSDHTADATRKVIEELSENGDKLTGNISFVSERVEELTEALTSGATTIKETTQFARETMQDSAKDVVTIMDGSTKGAEGRFVELSESWAETLDDQAGRVESLQEMATAAEDSTFARAEEAIVHFAERLDHALQARFEDENGAFNTAQRQIDSAAQRTVNNYHRLVGSFVEDLSKKAGAEMECLVTWGQEIPLAAEHLRETAAEVVQLMDDKTKSLLARTHEVRHATTDALASTQSLFDGISESPERLNASVAALKEASTVAVEDLREQTEALNALLLDSRNRMVRLTEQFHRGVNDDQVDDRLLRLAQAIELGQQALRDAASAFDDTTHQAAESAHSAAGRLMDTSRLVGDQVEMLRDMTTNTESANNLRRVTDQAAELREILDQIGVAAEHHQNKLVRVTEEARTQSERLLETVKSSERDAFLNEASSMVEALHQAAIDVDTILDGDLPAEVVMAIDAGDRGVSVRRLLSRYTPTGAAAMADLYARDRSFTERVDRYLEAFDSLLAQANRVDKSKLLHTTFLTADIGKLYVFLARSIGVMQAAE